MQKFYLFLMVAALAGCASSARLATEDGRGRRAPADPAAVAVYSSHDIGRRYQVIGTVIGVGDGQSGERALADLRKEAAALGANAVVDLRLEIERGFWDAAVKASGVAVAVEAGPALKGGGSQ